MKGRCNQCGSCCFIVTLNIKINKTKYIIKDDFGFCANNFFLISKEEAFLINPHLLKWKRDLSYFYVCKKYDKINKKCKDYKNRPNLCKNYPWYNSNYNNYKDLINEPFYNEKCGYIIDREIFKFIYYLNLIKEKKDG